MQPGSPAAKRVPIRTPKDLGPLADKLSLMFDTDVLVVVGSQAILVGWPNSPEGLRKSHEIDAFPANYRIWEEAQNRAIAAGEPSAEASEEINRDCGEGSTFHDQWGFFIDGVNGNTSPLPEGWQERAVYTEKSNREGGRVTVIAPCPEDMLVSKALRLFGKDKDFIELYHQFKPLDPELMAERIDMTNVDQALKDQAKAYFRSLPASDGKKAPDPWKGVQRFIPEYPADTHCAFYNASDNSVIIRKWDPDLNVYNKVDNPLGPAYASKSDSRYFIAGRSYDFEDWKQQPEVSSALDGTSDDTPPPWRMAS